MGFESFLLNRNQSNESKSNQIKVFFLYKTKYEFYVIVLLHFAATQHKKMISSVTLHFRIDFHSILFKNFIYKKQFIEIKLQFIETRIFKLPHKLWNICRLKIKRILKNVSINFNTLKLKCRIVYW